MYTLVRVNTESGFFGASPSSKFGQKPGKSGAQSVRPRAFSTETCEVEWMFRAITG